MTIKHNDCLYHGYSSKKCFNMKYVHMKYFLHKDLPNYSLRLDDTKMYVAYTLSSSQTDKTK